MDDVINKAKAILDPLINWEAMPTRVYWIDQDPSLEEFCGKCMEPLFEIDGDDEIGGSNDIEGDSPAHCDQCGVQFQYDINDPRQELDHFFGFEKNEFCVDIDTDPYALLAVLNAYGNQDREDGRIEDLAREIINA